VLVVVYSKLIRACQLVVYDWLLHWYKSQCTALFWAALEECNIKYSENQQVVSFTLQTSYYGHLNLEEQIINKLEEESASSAGIGLVNGAATRSSGRSTGVASGSTIQSRLRAGQNSSVITIRRHYGHQNNKPSRSPALTPHCGLLSVHPSGGQHDYNWWRIRAIGGDVNTH